MCDRLFIEELLMEDHLIVKTKITPPKLGKNILKRQRLLNLLRDNLDKKLILISADAGYGKTTLILDLASEIEQHRRAWLTVDKGDTELIVFMTYLVESIIQAYPNFGNKTKIVIKNITSANIEMVIGTFINELMDTLKDELFIFIDDYHLVSESKSINDALDYLLEHQPPKLHLIISTRTLPTVQLTKLSAKQQLFALKKEDLQFTEEEVKTLFKDIYHIDIPEIELTKLEEYTKGWVTALQLISQELSYKRPDEVTDIYSKAGEKVFEYFSNEIMQKLPKSLQDFMLKSSILESMESELLNNLLEISNSAEMLDSLVKLNLFISTIPGKKNAFKYHSLFREFLINLVNKTFDKELIKDLYRKAATYFTQVNDIESAILHWLASADYEKAADLIEKGAKDMIGKGRLNTVNSWINSLPLDLVDNHPWLLTYKGEIFYRWGEWDEALQQFGKAEKIFSKRGNKLGLCRTLYGIGTITILRGDANKGLELLGKALKLAPEKEYSLKANILNAIRSAFQRQGEYKEAIKNLTEALSLCKKIENVPLQTMLLHNLGAIHHRQGDFTRAEQIYKEVMEIYSKILPPWAGGTYNNMAGLSLMKGDYSQGKMWLERGIQICKDFNDKRGLANAYLTMGEVLSETQEYESAMEKYQEVLTLNLKFKDMQLQILCLDGIARLHLLQADYYRAEQCINKALEVAKEGSKNLWLAQVLLTKGEIAIAIGALDEAEKTLLDSLSIIENLGVNYDLTQVYFWLTQLYLKKAIPTQKEKLKYYIKEALRLASKYGYDHFLIKKCRNNFSFLDIAVRNKIEPRYAIFILSQIGTSAFGTLTSLFEIKDEHIQRWVIEGLVNIGDEHVLHWLEKLKEEEYPSLKGNISQAITRVQKVIKEIPKEVVYEGEKKVKPRFKDIIGNHPKMQELYNLLEKVIDTDATVLITGETGTGKELVARAIHYNSKRKDNKFIALACGAMPETLLESELFGYVKGAFTGAVSTKKGLFEEADGGTLFLDDVTNLTPGIQAKLLRVLEDKEIRPVGGLSSKKVDVRIITSTNKDLEKEVKEGKFRDDLYYRLTGITIKLPPLRERKSDIPLLAQHFLKKYSIKMNKNIKGFEKEVMDLLLYHDWPGNVRELEREIERLVVLCHDNIIRAANLSIATSIAPFREETMNEEQRMIINAITKASGNKTKAAKIIGWPRRKLYRRMKALNIPY
ncbi:MAG: sigma 54-interacting transcriptional regulator [bacterium]|nr:sigma 54-interacting transcriptional regulator [bacterium]